MHGPTCIFWTNLTPFSLQAQARVEKLKAEAEQLMKDAGATFNPIKDSWTGGEHREARET